MILMEEKSLSFTCTHTVLGRHSLSKSKILLIINREVTKLYMGKGVFTEFHRTLTETVVKKSKAFKQRNFMRGMSSIIVDVNDKDS